MGASLSSTRPWRVVVEREREHEGARRHGKAVVVGASLAMAAMPCCGQQSKGEREGKAEREVGSSGLVLSSLTHASDRDEVGEMSG